MITPVFLEGYYYPRTNHQPTWASKNIGEDVIHLFQTLHPFASFTSHFLCAKWRGQSWRGQHGNTTGTWPILDSTWHKRLGEYTVIIPRIYPLGN